MKHCPFCKVPHPETEEFYGRVKKTGKLKLTCHAELKHRADIRARYRARHGLDRPAEAHRESAPIAPLLRLAQSEAWG